MWAMYLNNFLSIYFHEFLQMISEFGGVCHDVLPLKKAQQNNCKTKTTLKYTTINIKLNTTRKKCEKKKSFKKSSSFTGHFLYTKWAQSPLWVSFVEHTNELMTKLSFALRVNGPENRVTLPVGWMFCSLNISRVDGKSRYGENLSRSSFFSVICKLRMKWK